jgi:Ca2+-binding EF-hand superfamily protein
VNEHARREIKQALAEAKQARDEAQQLKGEALQMQEETKAQAAQVNRTVAELQHSMEAVAAETKQAKMEATMLASLKKEKRTDGIVKLRCQHIAPARKSPEVQEQEARKAAEQRGAATVLQSKTRQTNARKEVNTRREQRGAATVLQSKTRQTNARKEVNSRREQRGAATVEQARTEAASVCSMDLVLSGAFWAELNGRYVCEGQRAGRPCYRCGHLYLYFLPTKQAWLIGAALGGEQCWMLARSTDAEPLTSSEHGPSSTSMSGPTSDCVWNSWNGSQWIVEMHATLDVVEQDVESQSVDRKYSEADSDATVSMRRVLYLTALEATPSKIALLDDAPSMKAQEGPAQPAQESVPLSPDQAATKVQAIGRARSQRKLLVREMGMQKGEALALPGTAHGESGFYEMWSEEKGTTIRAQFTVDENGVWALVGGPWSLKEWMEWMESGGQSEEQPAGMGDAWQKIWDATNEAYYFFHNSTGESQWERPDDYEDDADDVSVDSAAEVPVEYAQPLTEHGAATVLQSKARQGRAMRDMDRKREQCNAATVLQSKARQGRAMKAVDKKREFLSSLTAQSEAIFDGFDVQKNGVITREDYEELWIQHFAEQMEQITHQQYTSSGGELSAEQMALITAQWDKLDVKGAGRVTREEFVQVQTAVLRFEPETTATEELSADDQVVQVSETELQIIKHSEETFDGFDVEKKGLITREDFKTMWAAHYTASGGELSAEQTEQIAAQWVKIDAKGAGRVTREEFVQVQTAVHKQHGAAIVLQSKARQTNARKEVKKRKAETKVKQEKDEKAKQAPAPKAKSKGMGGVLMKAHQDGSLEGAVDQMEAALGGEDGPTPEALAQAEGEEVQEVEGVAKRERGAATVLQSKTRQGQARKEVNTRKEMLAEMATQSELIFEGFDVQKKGVITREDYEELWTAHYTASGGELSAEQMALITAQWAKIDVKGAGRVTREEFVQMQMWALHRAATEASAPSVDPGIRERKASAPSVQPSSSERKASAPSVQPSSSEPTLLAAASPDVVVHKVAEKPRRQKKKPVQWDAKYFAQGGGTRSSIPGA